MHLISSGSWYRPSSCRCFGNGLCLLSIPPIPDFASWKEKHRHSPRNGNGSRLMSGLTQSPAGLGDRQADGQRSAAWRAGAEKPQ